jgi:hypothetical protein
MSSKFSVLNRGLAVCLFVWGVVFAAQPSALAGGQVPFKATFSLEADVAVDPPIATVTSAGAGVATHLGAFGQRSIWESANLATGVGAALHEFTAANGDTLQIRFDFQLAPTATGFLVSGVWKVVSGTGRFVGASGSGTYAGVADFTSPTTVAAEFEMVGKISSVGSLK